jgi:hypothetical protein
MASFSEIVSTTVRAATSRLAEGSRRNALDALEARYDLTREGSEVLAALPSRRLVRARVVAQRHRPTA